MRKNKKTKLIKEIHKLSLAQQIEKRVYSYNTKSKYGFKYTEIEELLKEYPNINMNKYNDAMMGNTCILDKDDGKAIIYHCDVLKGILCGVEDRNLKIEEWD